MNLPTTDAKLAAIKENAYRSIKAILKRMEADPRRTMKSIYNEVSVEFDITPRMLENRMKKFREGGWEALNPSHGGKSPGDDSLLTEENEKKIQSIILDRTPDQLKLSFALWTRSAVQELIERELGIHLSITCVGNYLRRWGYTCQRPKLTASEQRPEQVKQWLEEEYPAIRAQAKAEDAEIWWGDETAVQNCPHQLRGFSPRGKTPILKSFGKRIHLTMISAVNNQGLVRFRLFKEAINVERFRSFLESMIQDASGRKVILIVDNLSVHHAKDLKPWLELNKAKIELRFLPSYSPDLNPDEYLNRDMKSRLGSLPMTNKSDVLNERVDGYMSLLSEDSDLVKSFFTYTPSKYAA